MRYFLCVTELGMTMIEYDCSHNPFIRKSLSQIKLHAECKVPMCITISRELLFMMQETYECKAGAQFY